MSDFEYEEDEKFNQADLSNDQEQNLSDQRMQQQSPAFNNSQAEHIQIYLNEANQQDLQKIDSFVMLEQKIQKEYCLQQGEEQKQHGYDQQDKNKEQLVQKSKEQNNLLDQNTQDQQKFSQFNKKSLLYKPNPNQHKKQQANQVSKQQQQFIDEDQEIPKSQQKAMQKTQNNEQKRKENQIDTLSQQESQESYPEKGNQQQIQQKQTVKQKPLFAQQTKIKKSTFSNIIQTGIRTPNSRGRNLSQNYTSFKAKAESNNGKSCLEGQKTSQQKQEKQSEGQQQNSENDTNQSDQSIQSEQKRSQNQNEISAELLDQQNQEYTVQSATPRLNNQKEQFFQQKSQTQKFQISQNMQN